MKLVAAFVFFTTGLFAWSDLQSQGSSAETFPAATQRLTVVVNHSIVLEQNLGVRRVSVANAEMAEAVAVSPTEIMINGKALGATSLILWDTSGKRSVYELRILPDATKLGVVRQELSREFSGQDVTVTADGGDVFLQGTVSDPVGAERAVAIASTLGKVVNLLKVQVPPGDPQVLLKVRFANIDRSVTTQYGVNLFSGLNSKMIGATSTGQFGSQPSYTVGGGGPTQTAISDALNILLFRPDIDLGAVIQDLETKQLAQILAEPDLLTLSGQPASFLAGGQFPYPTLQGGGSGVGQITIQFRDFGIRLNFLPTVTLRGSIHLEVTPEVSSLDPANGLTYQGVTIPGLDVRRVQTQVELQNGQSFVIAGLLDNRVTQTLNKMPGLSNIPVLGKLFESKSFLKSNSELLVIVTPEIVRPIPAGQRLPDLTMPEPFLKGATPDGRKNQVVPPGQENLFSPLSVPYELLIPLHTGPGPAGPEAPAPENSMPPSASSSGLPSMAPTSSKR